MGNEVERGLWHGMWNGARWGMSAMRNEVERGLWHGMWNGAR